MNFCPQEDMKSQGVRRKNERMCGACAACLHKEGPVMLLRIR